MGGNFFLKKSHGGNFFCRIFTYDHRLTVVQVVDFDRLSLQRKALSIRVLYFIAPRAFSAHLSHVKAGIAGAAEIAVKCHQVFLCCCSSFRKNDWWEFWKKKFNLNKMVDQRIIIIEPVSIINHTKDVF